MWQLFSRAEVELGRDALETGDAATALAHFDRALTYPENLGVGRPHRAREARALWFRAEALTRARPFRRGGGRPGAVRRQPRPSATSRSTSSPAATRRARPTSGVGRRRYAPIRESPGAPSFSPVLAAGIALLTLSWAPFAAAGIAQDGEAELGGRQVAERWFRLVDTLDGSEESRAAFLALYAEDALHIQGPAGDHQRGSATYWGAREGRTAGGPAAGGVEGPLHPLRDGYRRRGLRDGLGRGRGGRGEDR